MDDRVLNRYIGYAIGLIIAYYILGQVIQYLVFGVISLVIFRIVQQYQRNKR